MKIITEQEYNKRMNELGLFLDEDYDKYFLGDMAFWGNVNDDVNEFGDLIEFSPNGHLTYLSQSLMDLSFKGYKFVIGPGSIDDYGVKWKKALYCTNYKELFPKEESDSKTNMKNNR